MKYAKRRDGNERPIIAALEAAGATVTQLGDPGLPDLLVGYRGLTFLLEVKDPGNKGSARPSKYNAVGGRGMLTASQVKWWDRPWSGGARMIVETPEQALAAIGAEERSGR